MARNEVGERVTEFLNNNNAASPSLINTGNNGAIAAELVLDDNASQEDKTAYMSNADLFENPELANVYGATIERNPTFEYDDNSNPNNIQKGKFTVPSTVQIGNGQSNGSTSFTGGSSGSNNSTSTQSNTSTNQQTAQPQVVDRAELTANFMGKLRASGKEIKAGNLTAEDFVKSLQDEGISLGASQEDIDGAITSVKAVMNSLLGTAFASSVGEVMLASAIEEYKPSLSFGNEYKDAANNMLKNYASEVKLRQHNGKYYGNLEDLLRYINEHSPSKNTADFIYNSLKEYLKTEEGKKQFVMLDADSVDDAEFMRNVRKTAGERRAEAIKAGTLKRVNIHDIGEVVEPDRVDASLAELR